MAPIQAFVYIDFGCEFGDPKKLTEVSLLAVPRSQYFDPKNIKKPKTKKTLELRSDGFNLNTFNDIKNFINDQQKPVCLVSHNGHRFDFLILKRELQKLNVSLSDDVLCADCQYTFYDILKEGKPCRIVPGVKGIASTTTKDNHFSNSNNVANKMLSDNIVASDQIDDTKQVMTEQETLKPINTQTYEQNKKYDAITDISEEQVPNNDIIEKEIFFSNTSNVNCAGDQIASNKLVTDIQGCELIEVMDDKNMQQQNEKTPGKRHVDATNEHIANKRRKLDSIHLNPGNAKRKLIFGHIYKGKAVRRIYFEGDDKPKLSYELGAIYDREVKYPRIKHHPAANDVYMKFRISHKLGEFFLAWTDQIQLKFADVEAKEVVMRPLQI